MMLLVHGADLGKQWLTVMWFVRDRRGRLEEVRADVFSWS